MWYLLTGHRWHPLKRFRRWWHLMYHTLDRAGPHRGIDYTRRIVIPHGDWLLETTIACDCGKEF